MTRPLTKSEDVGAILDEFAGMVLNAKETNASWNGDLVGATAQILQLINESNITLLDQILKAFIADPDVGRISIEGLSAQRIVLEHREQLTKRKG